MNPFNNLNKKTNLLSNINRHFNSSNSSKQGEIKKPNNQENKKKEEDLSLPTDNHYRNKNTSSSKSNTENISQGQAMKDKSLDDANVNKDNSSKEGKDLKMDQSKGVKHIYTQKKDDQQDIYVDEAHSYSEKIEDGYYVKEKMSFVYYEIPGQGKTAQSGGKLSQEGEESKKSEQLKQNGGKQTDKSNPAFQSNQMNESQKSDKESDKSGGGKTSQSGGIKENNDTKGKETKNQRTSIYKKNKYNDEMPIKLKLVNY